MFHFPIAICCRFDAGRSAAAEQDAWELNRLCMAGVDPSTQAATDCANSLRSRLEELGTPVFTAADTTVPGSDSSKVSLESATASMAGQQQMACSEDARAASECDDQLRALKACATCICELR